MRSCSSGLIVLRRRMLSIVALLVITLMRSPVKSSPARGCNGTLVPLAVDIFRTAFKAFHEWSNRPLTGTIEIYESSSHACCPAVLVLCAGDVNGKHHLLSGYTTSVRPLQWNDYLPGRQF